MGRGGACRRGWKLGDSVWGEGSKDRGQGWPGYPSRGHQSDGEVLRTDDQANARDPAAGDGRHGACPGRVGGVCVRKRGGPGGLRTLAARDRAVEAWLRDEVVPAYDRFTPDPCRAVSLEEVRRLNPPALPKTFPDSQGRRTGLLACEQACHGHVPHVPPLRVPLAR